MNAKALRIGLRRGWLEHAHLVKDRRELITTLVGTVGVFVMLTAWIGDQQVEGTNVSSGTYMTIGFLAFTVFSNGLMTLPIAIATDREDGTLLRLRSIPGGVPAYLVGRAVTVLCQIVVQGTLILATGVALGNVAMPRDWVTLAWVTLLGTLAVVPLGAAIGCMLPGPKAGAGILALPTMILMVTSGVMLPVTFMPEAVQWVSQAFPLYWQGLGLRAAFLPDTMLAAEIGGSWRLPWAAAALTAWTVAGTLLVPWLIRRVTRRESGSRLAERQLAAQGI
ncbi:ABC-2 type transport system permease protein [Streptosporangium becharense]|uniref:Transport permease protein n=1 Tax=Streptosporangium becharense TaxID=1816182 RepID=A0A7W9MJ45_9ACTN|nr:ABC transporter permease [Streptosporangium becharense]MBB2913151.1 ABC-2 type transport system permease protein [Streptosporangium becharense]MBB5822134.1 ABC-2 type transport system permease protein [Streptosporangium becharense]